MRAGVRITGLAREKADLRLKVSPVATAENSAILRHDQGYSHVIAADGKWSAVRAAASALEKEQPGAQATALSWSVQHEQTWGVQVSVQEGALKEGEELLAGYRRDASHILYPKTLQGAIYALVMPLQERGGGEEEEAAGRARSSISIVCSDLLLRTHPWAAPLEAQVSLRV